MRWILLCLTLGLAQFGVALAQPMTTSQVDFDFDGTRLVGLLDVPTDRETQGLVIIVHGYGETDVVRQNWYYDLRGNLALRGFASFVWDKPGNGLSEGTFDINQPVESSADEVLAAAAFLRSQNIPGADNIGLWGISRAGWIAPLALTQDPDLVFWISVSGVDGKESFGYLLRSNWAVLGYSAETMEALHAEWLAGTGITATGGSYTEYLDATRRYHADPFVQQFYGGAEEPGRAAYEEQRQAWAEEPPEFDPSSGLRIYVPAFSEMLSTIDVPVLALFGEKDTSVDWRGTKALYESTIGQADGGRLTVKTFPNGNHNLHVSETGGFDEMLDILNEGPVMVPGYSQTIGVFLKTVSVQD